ncbi:hypothetical protein ACFOG5_16125 [Pedobacter fastidiosus]|uniref:hypothetical protein n=1 Tax=Pedobacter fastidiosus TaxID=2765361 RepID=UPI00360A1A8C
MKYLGSAFHRLQILRKLRMTVYYVSVGETPTDRIGITIHKIVIARELFQPVEAILLRSLLKFKSFKIASCLAMTIVLKIIILTY